MLVLSRRPHEKVEFPTLGISVEVLRVDGRTVRVGIDAPRSVPVVRGELSGADLGQPQHAGEHRNPPPRLDHRLRGCLNTATIALCVAQKQIEIGDSDAAQNTLQEALEMFASVERDLSEPATRTETRPTRRPTALVVEDNINECALLGSYLRLNCFEVQIVNDGQAALDYLASNDQPDLILLDMRLPKLSGPQTLESIRGNPSHRDLKVFAMTGSAESEFDIPTGPGGVDGWFPKPLNPPRMIEALKSAVVRN
jgi:carbon storage regulator CsrA